MGTQAFVAAALSVIHESETFLCPVTAEKSPLTSRCFGCLIRTALRRALFPPKKKKRLFEKKKVFSVCRPLGPKYGDASSVGYELLYRQVTRAQGIFSPRTVNIQFSLEYIAENLDAPTVVLQYPSKREFIRELKKGYDYVGISFLMAIFHKVKEMVALIRQYAPNTKIVLGGYGTVLNDEVLKPYADYICREEGVGFMRRLLGEPEIPMPYKHPLIVSWLKVFGWKVSGTGKSSRGWAVRTAATSVARRTSSSANTSSCCPTAKTSTPSRSVTSTWTRASSS